MSTQVELGADYTHSSGDVGTDFLSTAEDWADRAAIVHNGATTTYREFAERVRLTASRYRARRASNFIGVLVSHQPEVAEHFLGVLLAGGGYCPIDARLPDARKHALANALELDRLFSLDGKTLRGNTIRTEFVGNDRVAEDGEGPQSIHSPNDPGYVICTSGSTGAPKPVVVSRSALGATVRELRKLFELTPSDRVLQFASLAWDTCFEEMLPALTSGAALVFDDAAHSGSFPAFVRMLSEQGVTVVDLPTAFWHELTLYLHEEQTTLPGSIRLVVIGGERVDPTRLDQWRRLATGNVILLNTYGCTETTMITHAIQLAGPGTETSITAPGAEAPLGRPLTHIVDHVNDEGELLIAGPSLATGYLGLPDITDDGFPVEDHGSGPVRWFHTGDMATRRSDGIVYSLGRADQQVKVLGVRVHPAEVETHLNAHPAVACSVVVGERCLDRTSLTALVVPTREVSPGELKRFLRERLPTQFVPSKFTMIPALRYTASGKIDRAETIRAAAELAPKENEQ